MLGMNSRHWSNEDPKPKCSTDKPIIYNMRYCPYAQRAILVALHKNIECEVVNINLKNKPQWYLAKVNPLGMVPSITWNDFTAIESSVVGDYLDEKFPGPKLSAQSPEQKAKNASLIAIYGSKVLNQSYKLYREIPEEERAKTVENLLAGLTMIEEELAKRGTPFFHGQTVGTVDYYIWPWFERMFVLENHFKRVTFNWAENYPKLNGWFAKMEEDPAVKKYRVPNNIHVKFIESFASGNPNYEFLTEE